MNTRNSHPVVFWLTLFSSAILGIFHFAPGFISTAYIADIVELSLVCGCGFCVIFWTTDSYFYFAGYVSVFYVNSLLIWSHFLLTC